VVGMAYRSIGFSRWLVKRKVPDKKKKIKQVIGMAYRSIGLTWCLLDGSSLIKRNR